MTATKPGVRPATPHFSSGPCAKRPGWSLQALTDALSAVRTAPRSARRSSSDAIERSRRAARHARRTIASASCRPPTPARSRWRCGRCWAPRGVDMLAWESFGEGWVTDVAKQLKLTDVAVLKAAYGAAARSRPGRFRPRRGLHLERHHLRRARAERRLDRRRPRRPHHLRRHLGRLRADARLGQARCRHLLLAEGAGRRGARTAC